VKSPIKPKIDSLSTKISFWQPHFDLLRYLSLSKFGRILIIFLNYAIWFFLFFISYLLIKSNPNTFWQLLIATAIGEFIEKYGKKHALWRRPLFVRHDSTPIGLVDSWYQTGSFPSGHTVKVTYFFLFILQYHLFSSPIFLAVSLPLLFFRILVGFHYPIDMLGGAIIGLAIWFLTHQIIAPAVLTQIIQVIFNTVFFIRN
jgi:membrane-associated phospholipid phosphatase